MTERHPHTPVAWRGASYAPSIDDDAGECDMPGNLKLLGARGSVAIS